MKFNTKSWNRLKISLSLSAPAWKWNLSMQRLNHLLKVTASFITVFLLPVLFSFLFGIVKRQQGDHFNFYNCQFLCTSTWDMLLYFPSTWIKIQLVVGLRSFVIWAWIVSSRTHYLEKVESFPPHWSIPSFSIDACLDKVYYYVYFNHFISYSYTLTSIFINC